MLWKPKPNLFNLQQPKENRIMSQLQKIPVLDILQKSKEQIAAALPSHLKPERMMRIALTELRKNPGLTRCNPTSVIAGIIQSSQLGLEIGSGLGQAYLIPFKKECSLVIGYQGMIDIAYRSNKIKDLRAYVVRKSDYFRFKVTQAGEELTFEPNFEKSLTEATAENTFCVLAQATLVTGGTVSRIVPVSEIEKTRTRSKSQNVWRDNWEAMALKTGIRRLYKMLPKSIEMQAVERVESTEGVMSRDQQIDIIPESLLSVMPAEKTEDDEAFEAALGKLIDLSSSAQEILPPDEFAILQEKIKDGSLKEIINSIDIISTVLADKKG
ncbi:recombinase RecT [bacterium]|nr:recombinase RecT [bacterium]